MKRCSLNHSPIIVFVWFENQTIWEKLLSQRRMKKEFTATCYFSSNTRSIHMHNTDCFWLARHSWWNWSRGYTSHKPFSLETHRSSNVFPSFSITPVFMMMFIALQTVEDLYIQHGVMVLEPYRFIYFPNMKLHFTDMYFVYLIMFLITYCHLYVCVIICLIFFSLCSLSHRSKILCFPFCP